MTGCPPLIILHDYFETAEGGGRLCLELGRAIGADLAYGFKAKNHPFFQVKYRAGRELGLNAYSRLRVWKQFKLIRAFSRKTRFLAEYRIAVFSGFYSVCAAKNHPNDKNIYYCHTPPRFMYDQKDAFKAKAGWWGRPILKIFNDYYRPIYEDSVSRMDLVITNSKNVQSRIKKYLGLDSVVVFPPCDLKKYHYLDQKDFYLSMARLDPLKRVDQIVQAFLKMPDKNLVVISGGPEIPRIRHMAENACNIKIMGMVDEKSLIKLLGECIATIYIPKDEDFGMSPVESMAAGKPVLGVNEGGLLETIVHEQTGYLIPANPDVEDLIKGIRFLNEEKSLSLREYCIQQAKKFDRKIFLDRMREYLKPAQTSSRYSLRRAPRI